MKLKDKDVRISLHKEIENHFSYDRTTCVVDELQICNGTVRVDIAAINGAFHGYEIKSESDTLMRLPNQAEHYNKVFDYMYFVCGENQLEKSQQIIPDWWGIYIVYNVNGIAELKVMRSAKKNNNIDAFSLLQFLNKDELIRLGLLYDISSAAFLKKTPKYRLWQILSTKVDIGEISIENLSDYLRSSLKTREGGRAHLLQM